MSTSPTGPEPEPFDLGFATTPLMSATERAAIIGAAGAALLDLEHQVNGGPLLAIRAAAVDTDRMEKKVNGRIDKKLKPAYDTMEDIRSRVTGDISSVLGSVQAQLPQIPLAQPPGHGVNVVTGPDAPPVGGGGGIIVNPVDPGIGPGGGIINLGGDGGGGGGIINNVGPTEVDCGPTPPFTAHPITWEQAGCHGPPSVNWLGYNVTGPASPWYDDASNTIWCPSEPCSWIGCAAQPIPGWADYGGGRYCSGGAFGDDKGFHHFPGAMLTGPPTMTWKWSTKSGPAGGLGGGTIDNNPGGTISGTTCLDTPPPIDPPLCTSWVCTDTGWVLQPNDTDPTCGGTITVNPTPTPTPTPTECPKAWTVFKGCDGKCYVSTDGKGKVAGDQWMGTYETADDANTAAAACAPGCKPDGWPNPFCIDNPNPTRAGGGIQNNQAAGCAEPAGSYPLFCSTGTCDAAADAAKQLQFFEVNPLEDVAKLLETVPLAGKTLASFVRTVDQVITQIAGKVDCKVGLAQPAVVARAAVGFVNKWLGADLHEASKICTQWVNWACPIEIPGQAATDELYLHALANPSEWECWTRANGNCVEPAKKVLFSKFTRPGVTELGSLNLRGLLPDQEYRQRTRERGVVDQDDHDLFARARLQIPPAGEILSAASKGVFDPDLAAKLGMTEGEPGPAAYREWLKALGLGWYDPARDGGSGITEWATLLWRTKTKLPGVAEAGEMLLRLRESAGRKVTVSEEDYDNILATYGIPSKWRTAYRELLRTRIGLRQIPTLIQYADATDEQVFGWLQDLGYAEEDAAALGAAMRVQTERRMASEDLAAARSLVEQAWEIGTIDDARYVDFMQEQGLTRKQADRALALAKAKRTAATAKEVIKDTQGRYLAGMLTDLGVRTALQGVGVRGDRIDDYLKVWNLEKTGPRKQMQARELLKDTLDGLIAPEYFVARLSNLGYGPDDIAILFGELELGIQQRLAKLLEQQAKAVKQAQDEQKRAIKAQQQALKAQQSDLASHGSPGQLAKWLCAGYITEAEFSSRLTFLGWPEADQQRLASDACKGGKPGSRPPKPPKPTPTTKPPPLPPPAPPDLAPPFGYGWHYVHGQWVLLGDLEACHKPPTEEPPAGYYYTCWDSHWILIPSGQSPPPAV